MRIIIIIILVHLFASTVNSQSLPKETVARADDYFYAENYEQAIPVLLDLLEIDPESANLNYKLGVSYLYIDEEKEKSIVHLEQAVTDVSPIYNPKSAKERSAPLEAYYSLATAYHINNKMDDAIQYYSKFRSILNINDFETINFISSQIRACETAKKIMKKPVAFRAVNLGMNINTPLKNNTPIISGDGQTLVFSTIQETHTAIYTSKKTNGNWSDPVEITSSLNLEATGNPTGLSYDGTELYLFVQYKYEGNIYVSRLSNGSWSAIQALNKNINTKSLETHASISADGNTLYFTSERRGGKGGMDIYKSEKNATGDWGPAQNLGSMINTEFNEETPFVTNDGNRLYFSSEGHFNMGGYDIFYSKRTGTRWSKPVSMGYPINSTDDDIFYFPLTDETGLFAMYKNDSYGGLDIYEIRTGSSSISEVEITGNLTLLNYSKTFNPNDFRIDVRDESGNIVKTLTPYAPNGYFSYSVTPGNYELAVQGKDFKPKTEKVSIPKDYSDSKYTMNIELEPSDIFIAEITEKPTTSETKVEKSTPPVVTPKPVIKKPEPKKLTKTAIATKPVVKKIIPKKNIPRNKTFIAAPVSYGKDALYTIQIRALLSPVDVSYFSNLSDVNVVLGKDKFYRYTYGNYSRYTDAKSQLGKIIQMGYKDAFIKKIKSASKMPNQVNYKTGDYTIQLMALYTPVDLNFFNRLKDVKVQRGKDKFYRYTYGEYESYTNAKSQLKKLIKIGYNDAFIKRLK